MNLIQPKVEWWPQQNLVRHIARVGRICYKSTGKQPDAGMSDEDREKFLLERDKKLMDSFSSSGHHSMFRHGTAYFYIKNDSACPRNMWALLKASPFICYAAKGHKVWISTNIQLLRDEPELMNTLRPYLLPESEFIAMAKRHDFTEALWLLRMTMVVTTQISTSRELNRTSPNAIAEQSTRYCNMKKKGGVQICEPHWYADGSRWQRWLFRTSCRLSSWGYQLLLRSGLRPEDARGVLPLDTYTVVAYTYNLNEWAAILDLRYHGKTGKPHPNAKQVASEIRRIIKERMVEYSSIFDI